MTYFRVKSGIERISRFPFSLKRNAQKVGLAFFMCGLQKDSLANSRLEVVASSARKDWMQADIQLMSFIPVMSDAPPYKSASSSSTSVATPVLAVGVVEEVADKASNLAAANSGG